MHSKPDVSQTKLLSGDNILAKLQFNIVKRPKQRLKKKIQINGLKGLTQDQKLQKILSGMRKRNTNKFTEE